ncbi:phosphoribosylanthranilate isomerase [Saezia sanguinis]|uniref:phosphoribosylanthranilate isomerase n=1 Tax=Saezia sanguinis TaxID=1965230 RepID=UPI0030436444
MDIIEKRLRRTRIKICGLTREEDVDAAVAAGADAVGFILYRESPRVISVERALELSKRLPPFVTPVVLFVNAKVHEILLVQENIPNATFQFHGDEEPYWCESWGRPFLKGIRVHSDTDLVKLSQDYASAQALVLDSDSKAYGGSGKVFDWSLIPHDIGVQAVLSGGLNAANVKQAILQVQPWAVDVCTGVEVSPGIKDAKAIQHFVQSVRVADACLFEN